MSRRGSRKPAYTMLAKSNLGISQIFLYFEKKKNKPSYLDIIFFILVLHEISLDNPNMLLSLDIPTVFRANQYNTGQPY